MDCRSTCNAKEVAVSVFHLRLGGKFGCTPHNCWLVHHSRSSYTLHTIDSTNVMMSLFYNILGEESPLPPYLMMKPCCMYVYYCLHSSLYTYTYTCTCKLALYQTEIETYDSILEKLYFKNASLQRFDCLCMYYCWIILSCKCTAIHYT